MEQSGDSTNDVGTTAEAIQPDLIVRTSQTAALAVDALDLLQSVKTKCALVAFR